MEKEIKSLIGQKYVPSDNSWSLNMTSNKDYRLAGTMLGDMPKQCVIISDPYVFNIKSSSGFFLPKKFINVEYNGDHIRVLFRDRDVNADVLRRIKENEDRNNLMF